MKTVSKIILLSALVILAGCTTSQPSVKQQNINLPATALSQDTYVISLNGNDINSEGNPQTPLLRKCAALTLSKGYKYFQIYADPANVNACSLAPNQVGCMTLKMYQSKEDASIVNFSQVFDASTIK